MTLDPSIFRRMFSLCIVQMILIACVTNDTKCLTIYLLYRPIMQQQSRLIPYVYSTEKNKKKLYLDLFHFIIFRVMNIQQRHKFHP